MAADEEDMRQLMLMAIGVSTLFLGRLVHIENWLPGLTVKVQALKSVDNGDPAVH